MPAQINKRFQNRQKVEYKIKWQPLWWFGRKKEWDLWWTRLVEGSTRQFNGSLLGRKVGIIEKRAGSRFQIDILELC